MPRACCNCSAAQKVNNAGRIVGYELWEQLSSEDNGQHIWNEIAAWKGEVLLGIPRVSSAPSREKRRLTSRRLQSKGTLCGRWYCTS